MSAGEQGKLTCTRRLRYLGMPSRRVIGPPAQQNQSSDAASSARKCGRSNRNISRLGGLTTWIYLSLFCTPGISGQGRYLAYKSGAPPRVRSSRRGRQEREDTICVC